MKPIMKRPPIPSVLLPLICLGASPALADLNTLEVWGNAAGTTPPASFTDLGGGDFDITGGGADIWGGSDQGVFLWDNTEANNFTGDFTATVRHVTTTTPAPNWGRETLDARVLNFDAVANPNGIPLANDAHFMSVRRSAGDVIYGVRTTVGGGTDGNTNGAQLFLPGGNIATDAINLSLARDGNTMRAGYAIEIDGVVARYVQIRERSEAIFAAPAELVVGLGHQSHPQTITPDTNDINTASFEGYTAAEGYDPTFFSPPSGPDTWQMTGRVNVASDGEVFGAVYVNENDVATGEPLIWMLSATNLSTFIPSFGPVPIFRDPTPMEDPDLVPAANFRYDTDGGGNYAPGLVADVYRNGNQGNVGNLAFIANNAPNGTAIVPDVNWSDPNNGIGYPGNGSGGNVFTDAVPGDGSDANPAFGDDGNGDNPVTGLNDGTLDGNGEEDYGVDLTGEIFIPADGDRRGVDLPGGSQWILFEDAIDDNVYLEIDGQVLIDRGGAVNTTASNGLGGGIAIFDAGDPKFDAGAWVPFRMVMWEGGGGDIARLFWNAFDTNDTFDILRAPGTFGDFAPMFGNTNAVQDITAMELADLVPSDNFRTDDMAADGSGLNGEIYLAGNAGNRAANFATIDGNAPDGVVVIPNVDWTGGGDNDANYFGLTGPASFAAAVQGVDPADNTAGAFSGNQENYGVNITGQIFIPEDGDRTPVTAEGVDYEAILFTDGVDDYTYLEIDGQVLLDDNTWTSRDSVSNNGGHVTLFDASDAKYDDGEWVDFRMVTWEGGGGDAGALYWSAFDSNGSFDPVTVPGAFVSDFVPVSGLTQLGDESTDASFGASVDSGEWLFVFDMMTTATTTQVRQRVLVGDADGLPFRITDVTLDLTDEFTITWTSQLNVTYRITWSTDLNGFPNVVPGADNILGLGGSTSFGPFTNPSPGASEIFLRVETVVP